MTSLAKRTFALNFVGDVMLGRLIDQLFPEHVHEPEEARIAQSFGLIAYKPETPWGNTLTLLHQADLNFINLETSVTTHLQKWPDKVFNYRMHPANITALQAAGVSYAGLANNHTLDFGEAGLLETVQTVDDAGIAFAGAGRNEHEATRPAILRIPTSSNDSKRPPCEIHVWAASDHPRDWSSIRSFHSIDYSAATRARLKTLLTAPLSSSGASTEPTSPPALKIFSVHWGPNYAWQPSAEIRALAHFLIDECDVDIIHGHSSHHVQGVENYHGKLIIYGCGDFVDDYALVPEHRNDLTGIWRVVVREVEETSKQQNRALELMRLEIFPTKIERFAARRLYSHEKDAKWVREKIKELSEDLGTSVRVEDSGEGRIIIDLS